MGVGVSQERLLSSNRSGPLGSQPSQKPNKAVHVQLAVVEYLLQKSRSDRLPSVNGDRGSSSIWMLELMMTANNADNLKPSHAQGCNELSPLDTR